MATARLWRYENAGHMAEPGALVVPNVFGRVFYVLSFVFFAVPATSRFFCGTPFVTLNVPAKISFVMKVVELRQPFPAVLAPPILRFILRDLTESLIKSLTDRAHDVSQIFLHCGHPTERAA